MHSNELINIWKSQDQKLDNILSLNKELVYDMTKNKLNTTIGMLKVPKSIVVLLGIPYTIFLYFITFIAYKSGGYFVTFGFGMICLIMNITIIGYIYQLYLINSVSKLQNIVEVQKKISLLKISSFNLARLAILQLPFWSICWMSVEALWNSPIIYGGINLMVFLILFYIAYWIYTNLSIENKESKVSKIFFSGIEWDPIVKSSDILIQIIEMENKKSK